MDYKRQHDYFGISKIDYYYIDNNQYRYNYMSNRIVICIPKLDTKYDRNFIYNTFNHFKFGNIKKIDLIKLNNFNRAFIHYTKWNNDDRSIWVKNILDNGEDFKIIYDSPWFWKCSKSLSKSK